MRVPAATIRPSASSTTPSGRPQRRAGSGVRNGPWVRAQRASRPSSAAVVGARNASGTPAGGGAPTPSRYRATSSIAIQRSSAPTRTRTARRLARRSSSHGPRPRSRPPREHRSPPPTGRPAAGGDRAAGPAFRRAGRPPAPAATAPGSGQGVCIEQFAEFLLAQEFPQQVPIECESPCPPFRERRIALVHVRGDVVEQERGRERRGAHRLDGMDADLATLDAAQHIPERVEVEDVGQTLPILVSTRIGKLPCRDATASRSADRWRCCQSGVRVPGRRRGRSRARPAFSRKREANSAEPPSVSTTRSSISSGLGNSSASISARRATEPSPSPSGRRIAMPSSDQMVWASIPSRSRRRCSIASVQGAWIRPPNGLRSTSRQSPSSSRKRWITIRRSVGSAPETSSSSSR